MNIHICMITLLSLLVVFYVCFLYKHSDFLINQKIDSLLDKNQSLMFEIFEIVLLTILIIMLCIEEKYVVMSVFMMCLIEHIFQIVFCYRQTKPLLQIITICIFLLSILYSFYIKYYKIIPIFMFGFLIHVVSLIYNKSFTDKVCI